MRRKLTRLKHVPHESYVEKLEPAAGTGTSAAVVAIVFSLFYWK